MSSNPNPLLSYQLQTTPMPIEASPEIGDPNEAALTLTVSSPGTTYVENVTVSFDVGDGAEYLTDVATGISASCSPSSLWQVATENNGDQVAFLITPIGSSAVGFHGQGPTIAIYSIQVGHATGAAVLTITENSSTTDGNFEPRTTEMLVVKMPTRFFVSDFATETSSVANGGTAVLTWTGSQNSQTTYTISWHDQAGDHTQDVTGDRAWTTPPLYSTTTFVLKAETQYLGETRTKYLSTTVTVNTPSVAANDLTVSGSSMFNDTQFYGTAVFNSIVTLNHSVQANSGLTSAVLTVLGESTLQGNVKVGVWSSTNPVTANLNVCGTVSVRDPAGNTRVALNVDSYDNGQMAVYNASSQVGVHCYIDGNGNGDLMIKDNSGSTNNHDIHLYIDDTDGYSAISLGNSYIRSNGVKNFRLPHPNQPDSDIWYTCIEGPEAAVYARGTARLVNGQATVELPEHFVLVSGEALTTVMLTPLSAESLGLAVVKKKMQSFTVRELHKGTGNYKFDWEVKAVRAGFEDYEVVRKRRES